jgi:hypothetical protein
MIMIITFFLQSFSLQAAPVQQVYEAKATVKALIQPLLPRSGNKKTQNSAGKFRIDQCEKHKVNWTDVLLMRQTVTLSYRMKAGCDLEGDITPRVLQPFPVKLKLRNLESYENAETQAKINASFESKPIMMLELREGTLTGGKGMVRFEADYQVRINPLNQAHPLEENLGGELRITEINGEKVNLREKIKVD